MIRKGLRRSDINNLIQDKKLRPWFWIITALYIGLAAILMFFFYGPDLVRTSGKSTFFATIFIIPYFIFSTIYIAWVHRKDK